MGGEKTFMRRPIRFAALALVAAAAAFLIPARAGATGTTGAILLKGTIVTMDDSSTVVHGAVLIESGKVHSILGPNDPIPSGATVVDTKGFIYPGLMSLHDHTAYNFLPLYPVPQNYTNRDQWPSGKLYETLVNNPKNLVTDPGLFDAQTEALKYAEIKAIAGGCTTIQGTPADAGVTSIL